MNARLLAAMGVALLSTGAYADSSDTQAKLNKRLHGQFASQEITSCLRSDNGFGPPPQLAALGPVHASSGASQYVATFNGDGTFTVDGTVMSLVANPVPPANSTVTYPVTTSTFSCSGQYQVNADNTYTSQSTCVGNTTSGSLPGLQFNSSSPHYSGRIANKSTILYSSIAGESETITTTYGTDTAICVHTGIGKKMSASEVE